MVGAVGGIYVFFIGATGGAVLAPHIPDGYRTI